MGEVPGAAELMAAAVTETLHALAGHLARRRADMLHHWRRAVEEDTRLATDSKLSLTQFYDHIPEVLDGLEQRLRSAASDRGDATTASEREGAAKHGKQRWRQGYGQRALMREWHHLHLVLVDELEAFADEHPEADRPGLARARHVLAALVGDALCESVEQFAQLQQADARGRTQALEDALAELGAIESHRAAIWHEAAHDLRGSLSVVRNAGELLRDSQATPNGRISPLIALHRAVEAMQVLLTDLLNLARLEAGHEQLSIAAFDAGALMTELCDALRPMAETRKLTLVASGPATLAVEGDRAKTYRIAQNLLGNAIKYTHKGGVRVHWGLDPTAPAAHWLLHIQDTGPGLQRDPAQDSREGGHAQVRNPQSGGGEGIGLSIVKRLCELLGVRFETLSSSGQGTAFLLAFPSSYAKDETDRGGQA